MPNLPTPGGSSGTWGTELNNFLAKGGRVYDVKHGYGAAGDGVTNDRAACQTAIDAAAASTYGGIVYFPVGDYLIGTPGLVLPTSQQQGIVLAGAAHGTNEATTRLIRNGAYALLSAAGTGTTGVTISHDLWLRDMTLAGAAQAATLVRLDRCAGVLFQNVRLQNSARAALYASQLWNSRFLNCLFETSGNAGATTAAVLLDGYAGSGTTNTVHFTNCHWEGNAYHNLELDGADAASRCTGVIVMNSKWEGDTAGSHVHFKQAQYCQVVGGMSSSNGGSTSPNVLSTAGILNNIVGLTFIGTSNTYLIQLTGGQKYTIAGCGFIGGSGAHIRLDSAFGEACVDGNSHWKLTSEVDVSDARTVTSVASATSITVPRGLDVVTVTGTTGIFEINSSTSYPGRRITLVFAGALTVNDFTNLKLAGNFVTTADDTLTLVCTDGTNWYEVCRSVN